jgi:4-amino-4-deoxy-L-arabinose transferase-like glycosyltransferase
MIYLMSKRIGWVSLVLVGLIITIAFYLRSESWMETSVVRPLQKDAADYFYYAYNLRHDQTYSRKALQPSDPNAQIAPDAIRPPGYPLFLLLLVDGPPSRQLIKKIQFWQMILSTLTVVAAYFLFRCFLPPVSGYFSALLVALSPHLIVFNSYLLTETLFCFMLVLIGLLICRYAGYPSIWLSILIGVVMALTTLIRPSLQFFPVVMAFLLWLAYGRKTGIKLFAYICLGFVLIMAPWYIRNLVTLNKASDKSLMINFLHHGMYPDFKYKQMEKSYRRPYQFDPRSEKIRTDLPSVTAEIIKRFREEPGSLLKWYLLGKPVSFWSWDMVQGHGDMYVYYVSQTPFKSRILFQWIQKLMQIFHGPLVLLSILGSLIVWIAPRVVGCDPAHLFMARYISALLIYFTALHMVGAPFPRYSVPLRPFQYAMALYALQVILSMKITNAVSSKPGDS